MIESKPPPAAAAAARRLRLTLEPMIRSSIFISNLLVVGDWTLDCCATQIREGTSCTADKLYKQLCRIEYSTLLIMD